MSEPQRGGIVRPPAPVHLEPGEGVQPISEAARARLAALADAEATMNAVLGPTPVLDPRWEWIDVSTYSGGPEYVKGACRHLTPAEVRSTVTGELLAYLCPDCDAQLPA